jgi:hypothetical protein
MFQKSIILVLLPLCMFLMTSVRLDAADEPSPVGLLRGAELARMQHESIQARITIVYSSPPPQRVVDCLLEFEGDKLRSELDFSSELADEDRPSEIIVRNGAVFYGYRKARHQDVHIYDLDRAVGVRGDIAFDPRVLGLSDVMAASATVKSCLWYENMAIIDLIGKEVVNGTPTWRVSAVTDVGVRSDYWIEEPSFRIHRRTILWPEGQIELDSEFDREIPSPFPKRVKVRRTEPGEVVVRTYTIEALTSGTPIPSERFSLRAMGIPPGTAVVDYRIQRRQGFWNGDVLLPTTVSGTRNPAHHAPSALPADSSVDD